MKIQNDAIKIATQIKRNIKNMMQSIVNISKCKFKPMTIIHAFFMSTKNFRSKPLLSTNGAYKKSQKPLCALKSGQILYVLKICLNFKTP